MIYSIIAESFYTDYLIKYICYVIYDFKKIIPIFYIIPTVVERQFFCIEYELNIEKKRIEKGKN